MAVKKNQERTWTKELENGDVLVATVRHDDRCGNGANTFSVTADLYDRGRCSEPYVENSKGKRRYLGACGCLHDEVRKHFPGLVPLIRWHLTSTDGPMHYRADALYWAGHSGWCDGKPSSPPNLEHLKSTIVYGAVPGMDNGIEDIWQDKEALSEWLDKRLEALLTAFRADVESLGFEF